VKPGGNAGNRGERAGENPSGLDRVMPVFQFVERHAIEISAPRARVDSAIREVTAGEIFLFRALTALRRMGRSSGPGILNPPLDRPILETATRTTFRTLVDEPEREIVVGTVVIAPPGRRCSLETADDYRALAEPGFAIAAMSFEIEEIAGGSALSTETRVFATDPRSRGRFALYWALIRPGSGFIRRMWLRAIKRRAESG